MEIFEYVINFFAGYPLPTLLTLFVVFAVLGRLTPCNKQQPLCNKGILTDAGYYFIAPLFGRFIHSFYFSIGIALLFASDSQEDITRFMIYGFGPLGQLPLWAQAAISFILSDIILYWTHRAFHTSKLWPFHSIHHSATHVDWHTTYRFHPVNVWLSFTLVDALMIFMGLSMRSLWLMATFNAFYSSMVHANLNWTFGPFKHIFASPVFHRWHHTTQIEGLDKNFAPTFPLLDIMFGTFYMPEGKLPEHYGVLSEPIPQSFLKQLVWPFRRKTKPNS